MSQEDDDTLVTKWLLLGGIIWDSNTHPMDDTKPRGTRWFAIERDKDERSGLRNTYGTTPADAIRNYIEKFKHTEGEEWLELLRDKSTTSSAPTPTTHPTEQ